MRAYPTSNFQTRYPKHTYFLFGLSKRPTRVVHITGSRFGIIILTVLHFWIICNINRQCNNK